MFCLITFGSEASTLDTLYSFVRRELADAPISTIASPLVAHELDGTRLLDADLVLYNAQIMASGIAGEINNKGALGEELFACLFPGEEKNGVVEGETIALVIFRIRKAVNGESE